MENLLLLTWKWFEEDGKPGAFMWATLSIVAIIAFVVCGVLIWRLGRKWRTKLANSGNDTNVVPSVQVDPNVFEKRVDDNQLDFMTQPRLVKRKQKLQSNNELKMKNVKKKKHVYKQ